MLMHPHSSGRKRFPDFRNVPVGNHLWIRTTPRASSLFELGAQVWSIPKIASIHFDSTGSHLERYATVFNCCEINSSFYRGHMQKTWERWAASVPADFRFAVKIPRTISHEAALNCDVTMLSAFFQQIKGLHDKLGPVLIQLPPKLRFELVVAKKFLTILRECYSGDVVWEPRHASWFDPGVEKLLKEFRVARVAADPAVVPAAGQPGRFSDLNLLSSPRFSAAILLGL